MGVWRAKSIAALITNQLLGIPAGPPQQIQCCHPCKSPAARFSRPAAAFARKSLVGCKQWRLILPLTFLPSPPEGDWTVLTVLHPFQFCKLCFLKQHFLRNRMWIGLRWDSMSDASKKCAKPTKNKDILGKQPKCGVWICHE